MDYEVDETVSDKICMHGMIILDVFVIVTNTVHKQNMRDFFEIYL